MIAVGIDACTGGWVAVALVDGGVDRVWFGSTLPVVLAGTTPGTTVGIDLPLGGTTEWRTADAAAKRLLGAQHSSVFSVPPRPVWDEPTFDRANARCRELTGKGLSRQAYNLLLRMVEAEEYRDTSPHELYEVHPELVFRELASGTSEQSRALAGGPLPYGKKTWNGQMARRALLARVGVVLADWLPEVRAVPADDVLDAAAVAWCAYGIGMGSARHVPDPPDQHDHRGRPIVIWTG